MYRFSCVTGFLKAIIAPSAIFIKPNLVYSRQRQEFRRGIYKRGNQRKAEIMKYAKQYVENKTYQKGYEKKRVTAMNITYENVKII